MTVSLVHRWFHIVTLYTGIYTRAAWLSGSALVSINEVGPVSRPTGIGNRLWVGKPSRFVTSVVSDIAVFVLKRDVKLQPTS